MNNVGNEGIADWFNGVTPSQIKRECDRLVEIVEKILPKYPDINKKTIFKYKTNIDYSALSRVYVPNNFVSVFNLFSPYTRLDNNSINLYNTFHDFLNELAKQFNRTGSYYVACMKQGLSMTVGVCVWNGYARHKYKYIHTEHLDINIYKQRTNVLNTSIKVFNSVFNKYTDIKKYVGKITKATDWYDESDVYNYLTGTSRKIPIYYYDFHKLENRNEEEYNRVDKLVKEFIKECKDTFIKYQQLKDCTIEHIDDRIYLVSPKLITANESLYSLALSQYNYISNYNFDYGSEGLYQAVARFVRGILNTLFKILNNFKAIVTRGFKDLKRTELEGYIDSNKFSLSYILNVNYTNLTNLEVDVPLGMVKPYKYTLEKVNSCLEVLAMRDRTTGMLNSVNSLLTSLMSNTNTVITKNTIHTGELKSLENLYKEVIKCFNTSVRKETRVFTEVFESEHCLGDTFELLKKATKQEYEVSKVFTTLETLYSKFDQILKLIERNETTLTKEDLLHLSSCTTTLAKLFDMYGLLIHDLQRIEHNFVLVLKTIQKNFEL